MRHLLLLITLLALLSPSKGQQSPRPVESAKTPSWTSEALIDFALRNNAELKFYEAGLAASKGQRTQASLWKNPEFEGELGTRRTKDPSGSLEGEGTTRSFSVTQTFEFPGKGSLRKAIANKDVEIAELALQQFRTALSSQVRSLAQRHLLARGYAESAEEVSERSSALIDLLKQRPNTGAAQLLELRIIEASLLALKKEAKEALMEREETRLELTSLLGLPSSTELAVQQAKAPSFPDIESSKMILQGLNQNLSLKVHVLELEKAMREVSAARLEAAPDFSIGPFFSQDKAGGREENAGILLSTTLPLWNWNQGNIATAQARRAQADSLLLDARRKVEREISRRCRAYTMSRKLLQESSAETVSNLRQAAELSDRQYRLGAINVQLYLESQKAFLETQKLRNETLLDTWQNFLDLKLLTGESLATQ